MFSPRWRKVWRDLRDHGVRTVLVVLSIAVGAFAVGTIAGARAVLGRELHAAYRSVRPAHAVLYVEPFGDDLVEAVRRMDGVEAAEGRTSLRVRVRVGADEWRDLVLFAIPDFGRIQVDQVRPWRGPWPPPRRQLLLERASLSLLGARVGDRIEIETPRRKRRELPVAGLAHDLNQAPAIFSGTAYGYVTFDTLAWLGEPRAYDELHLRVAGAPGDQERIRRVAEAVRDKIERGGTQVRWMWLPEPDRHPADSVIEPLLLLLGSLGLLVLAAGGFLVVNTVNALLAQQVRQVGIMKAIGAQTGQVAGMYLAMVAACGLLAFAIAGPGAAAGARALSSYVAGLLNVDLADARVPLGVFALQAATCLAVPLGAAVVPVLAASRISVREALTHYGIGQGSLGRGRLDRLLQRAAGLPRPVLLSLRNAFRRKARLALTLVTLTLGGALFIAVFSVRACLLLTMEEAFRYWQYDVEVRFTRPYRIAELQREVLSVPGVAGAESWSFHGARVLLPDGSERSVLLIGLPAATRLLRPTLAGGRWLLPEDENAVVVNTELLEEAGPLRVGDVLELRVDGRTTRWRVVGLVKGTLSGPIAYANYPYVARVTGEVERAGGLLVTTWGHDATTQAEVAARLERHFRNRGMPLAGVETTGSIRARLKTQFGILVGFLLIMALLLAVVGGLGLMGTMSINVLERTREIGVMRAIGGDSAAIRQIFVVEGMAIGMISWVLAALAALPLSRALSDAVGLAFMNVPLRFRFEPAGVALWLGVVTLLSALASLLPAWRAGRLGIREVLAYE